MDQTAERHRQHKEVDQEQVQRKQPNSAPDMGFIDVLHDHDLKLPGQKYDGEPREQDQGGPGDRLHRLQPQQPLDAGQSGSVRKDVPKPVEHPEGDE